MTQELLKELFQRDLEKLTSEIEAYKNEDDLWKIAPGISNSAGNLALHLIGNLKHFLGAVLGKNGYVRNRDGEFNDKGIPKQQLISDLKETQAIVSGVINHLSNDDLEATYPVEVFGKPMKTGYFLIHLYGHLNYHLGQVNYHRRLLSNL